MLKKKLIILKKKLHKNKNYYKIYLKKKKIKAYC